MTFKNVARLKYFGMPARNKNDISHSNQMLIKLQKCLLPPNSDMFFLPITKQHFCLFFHIETRHNLSVFLGTMGMPKVI
jgi:hypothetical protein